jgi:hypothetical protein
MQAGAEKNLPHEKLIYQFHLFITNRDIALIYYR